MMIAAYIRNIFVRRLRDANKNCSAQSRASFRWPIAIGLAAALTVAGYSANAEDPDVASRRAAEHHDFTNAQISDGFFKIAFGAELQVDNADKRVRKFDEPVRIFVDNKALPDRSAQLAQIVADIRRRVKHLDLAITDDRKAANFIVSLVADREVEATISSRYGSERAGEIQKSLNPQCLSGIAKDKHFRIRRAEVILPVDAGEFTFYDCGYEEMLQALGAINDDRSVPWTMFNDDVQMGFFDIYDQYLLNILYDPRIKPGMSKEAVAHLMPEILATTRNWIASRNPSSRRDQDHAPSTHAAAQGARGAQTD